jgi:ubiquinone/menaquinone biosynthesis C-methylase UbiE
MTDDIYFDQSFEFTKKRFFKNDIDPYEYFGGKTVLDAGCGSGKFSCAIARFGAVKVIGLDIGEKGLEFARKQAKKTEHEKILKYKNGSLLDIPLSDNSVDIVWSNGVIHHTLDYEKCIQEFWRVIKPGGNLFLYVNGRFGLFELLCDSLRLSISDVPRQLQQLYLLTLGVNSGRLYWMLDCMNAPYEWKSKEEVLSLLKKYGFDDIIQLTRGISTDQVEQVSTGLSYAKEKYGEAQLKFICKKY